MAPIRSGTAEQFAAAREVLRGAGFNEPAVCRHYGVARVADYKADAPRVDSATVARDGFTLLVRLLMEGKAVTRAEMDAHLGPHAAEAFTALGLVEPHGEGLAATATLVPTNGLYLASDRWLKPDGSPSASLADIVYPGHIPNTQMFVTSMPEEPCEALLDLCAGSGVAALVGARFAERAWATDIADRSTQFAEFNRQLNGVGNMECLTGDLYEPVRGLTFDRIVAHPPYVPVLEQKWIFYGGGADGEQVLRGCIEGLPAHLRPGGRFYALSMATDRVDAPLERRLREMLGEAEREFDVAVIEHKRIDPMLFAERSAIEKREDVGNLGAWRATFERLGVTSLIYGNIILQRRDEERPVFTVRRPLGDRSGRAEQEWMLRWETAATQPGTLETLLRSRLDASRATLLTMTHRLQGDKWVPFEFHFLTEYPFNARTSCHPWMAAFVSQCDGAKTGMDLFEAFRRQGIVAPEVQPEQFASSLLRLVSAGLVECEAFPLPGRASAPTG